MKRLSLQKFVWNRICLTFVTVIGRQRLNQAFTVNKISTGQVTEYKINSKSVYGSRAIYINIYDSKVEVIKESLALKFYNLQKK